MSNIKEMYTSLKTNKTYAVTIMTAADYQKLLQKDVPTIQIDDEPFARTLARVHNIRLFSDLEQELEERYVSDVFDKLETIIVAKAYSYTHSQNMLLPIIIMVIKSYETLDTGFNDCHLVDTDDDCVIDMLDAAFTMHLFDDPASPYAKSDSVCATAKVHQLLNQIMQENKELKQKLAWYRQLYESETNNC